MEAEQPTVNQYMRADQIQGWQGYPAYTRLWIMMVNYFFAVLPGILILIRQVYLEDEKITKNSSLDLSFWFIISVALAYIGMSVFQIVRFQRFMSLRLTATFMVGQIVALVAILLTLNDTLLKKIKSKLNIKDNKFASKAATFMVVFAASLVPFLLHAFLNPLSELWVSS
jgi:hypothetical protein